ncbi:hypothetical protein Gotur_001471, partial [Gossypium turneri]
LFTGILLSLICLYDFDHSSLWQVQHPRIQDLMMIGIRNLQAFALHIQKNDIKFDLFSITKEMEKQVSI